MDNLHLIQLGQYERPTISEERNKDWVSIGDNNDYYQSLIDAYMDSTTNNAVINGVVNQIYGKGLDATDSAEKPDQYAQMMSLVKPHDLRNVCQDLKLLGEAAFQITYNGSKISAITHFPRETLRAEKMNEKGEVKNYFYSADWTKVNKNTKLKKFPVFGSGGQNEIYIVKRYVTGFYYYSPADYNTAYATLENEIACYLINDTQNGFSGTKVVNFNNGVPDREKQLAIKNDVMSKLTGSYGEKVIIAFNNNAESKTTVEDIPLNDAPAHYSYLSEECSKKIMLTHRVTSPLLLGLSSANGFSSNADEIENASRLFNNVVIQPYQNLLVDCLDTILAVNDISLNLYFKTIEPLEFMDLENVEGEEAIEEQTGIKEEDTTELEIMASNAKKTALDELIDLGQSEEEVLNDYDLVHESEVDYDLEDELDFVVTEINKTTKKEFASTGRAYPKAKSSQDGESKKKSEEGVEFLVRYFYEAAPNPASSSRTFCDKMRAANKLYRKEDIIRMGEKAVNPGFGKSGADTYSIWLYKGGARCNHRWTRKLFSRKGGRSLGEAVSTTKAIKRGFRPETNAKKVSIAPKNMKYAGYTAAYWNKKGFEK
tara:strand:- start:1905 stop:3701 length:1797 start_codon:yes stop_codon:yes gene_type:complete